MEPKIGMDGETLVVPTLNIPAQDISDLEAHEEAAQDKTELEDGISSIPDSEPPERSDLISTIKPVRDQEPSAEDAKSDEEIEDGKPKEEAAAEEGKTKEEEAEPEKKDKLSPFHEHPDWQRMKKKMDELTERNIRLETLLEQQGRQEQEEEELPFENIAEMEDDAIQDMIDREPKKFYSNLLKQAKHEVRAEVLNEVRQETGNQTYQQRVNTTFEEYADKNDDFLLAIEDGSIENFIKQNPGHNAISAHMTMKAQKSTEAQAQEKEAQEKNTQKRIDEAVEKAKKEQLESFKVKRHAAVLDEGGGGGGGGAPKTHIAPELTDTKKMGGLTNALVARLKARRQAKSATG